MAETSTSLVESIMGLVQAQLLDVNTCLPGKIVSYENGVARVAPTVKKRYADGDVLDYPIIPNVRVCWPSFAGGSAGVKGPVKAGDKCLIVFSQQAVDDSDDRRMFDLSDAYCIMCDLGGTAGDSTNNTDMTVFYGGASVRLSAGGKVTITAPGGLDMVTPATTNSGTFNSAGAITGAGVALSTHKHGGVTSGPAQTSPPV